MRDLSARGIYRRHVVEPAVEFFGTTDPAIVGDPNEFKVRADLVGPGSVWMRAKLESLSRVQTGPASWYQNVCDNIVGSVSFRRTWTHVDVEIMLVPDADVPAPVVAGLQATWKAGIESTWNNPVRTVGGAPAPWKCGQSKEVPCRISFQVHWAIANPHHIVHVHKDSGATNESHWYAADDGSVAAHEFGHMLGLPDEYVDDDKCPGRAPVNTDTVMDQNKNFIPSRLVQWVAEAIGSALL